MADIYSIKDPAQTNVEHNMYCIGQGYGTCETATATSGARIVTLNGYKLVKGFVSVRFSYKVPSSATMNINGQGAYPIKHAGSSIRAGIIDGGYSMATFYFDGTAYNLVSVYDSNAVAKLSVLLYDFYSVQSSDSVKTDGNTKYILLEGETAVINSDTIENGTRITISFDLQLGVQGLAQAGLVELNFKFEDTTDQMFYISDIGGNALPISDFMGVKSITADYCSADGAFYLSGVVYETTDTATNGSSALITSGGVYTILGDIETLLAAI